MNSSSRKLFGSLKEYDSQLMFCDETGRSRTYAEVASISECKAFMRTHRKLVFCIIDNDLNGITGYISLMLADAVPLMLQANINTKILSELYDLYKPSYIWLPKGKAKVFARVSLLLILGDYVLISLDNPEIAIHSDLSLLLGTSGSTGSPKYVRLSHENVRSNALAISQLLDLTEDEIPITTLPPSYTYGLSIIHSHLFVGATIALTNSTFFDRTFWDYMVEVRATSFGGVPYHYEILKKLSFTSMYLPSLKTLTQAGGKMEKELTLHYARHCANRGMRFFTMYGQTEATARMSYLPADKAIEKAGSIGIAIPGGKFLLDNEYAEEIDKDGMIGELVYEGPNVSMGYATCVEDLALGNERHGVLRTGDLGMRDGEGNYYIVGRLKRFIKLYGRRLNLDDVEKFLTELGHMVACAGQDDCLEIYIIQPTHEGAKQIKKQVCDFLQVAPKAVSIFSVLELPRNESSKIKYAELVPKIGVLLA